MNDELRKQIERLDKATGMDIFRRLGHRGEPGGYRFICPGVALSEDEVRVEIRDRMWHLSHDATTGSYIGVAEDMVCAYLALIADRCGYTATFTRKPDSDEEGR